MAQLKSVSRRMGVERYLFVLGVSWDILAQITPVILGNIEPRNNEQMNKSSKINPSTERYDMSAFGTRCGYEI